MRLLILSVFVHYHKVGKLGGTQLPSMELKASIFPLVRPKKGCLILEILTFKRLRQGAGLEIQARLFYRLILSPPKGQ